MNGKGIILTQEKNILGIRFYECCQGSCLHSAFIVAIFSPGVTDMKGFTRLTFNVGSFEIPGVHNTNVRRSFLTRQCRHSVNIFDRRFF